METIKIMYIIFIIIEIIFQLYFIGKERPYIFNQLNNE